MRISTKHVQLRTAMPAGNYPHPLKNWTCVEETLDQNAIKHCESAPYIFTNEKMINMMIQQRFKLFVYFD